METTLDVFGPRAPHLANRPICGWVKGELHRFYTWESFLGSLVGVVLHTVCETKLKKDAYVLSVSSQIWTGKTLGVCIVVEMSSPDFRGFSVGNVVHQVFTRTNKTWNKKDNLSGSAAAEILTSFSPTDQCESGSEMHCCISVNSHKCTHQYRLLCLFLLVRSFHCFHAFLNSDPNLHLLHESWFIIHCWHLGVLQIGCIYYDYGTISAY